MAPRRSSSTVHFDQNTEIDAGAVSSTRSMQHAREPSETCVRKQSTRMPELVGIIPATAPPAASCCASLSTLLFLVPVPMRSMASCSFLDARRTCQHTTPQGVRAPHPSEACRPFLIILSALVSGQETPLPHEPGAGSCYLVLGSQRVGPHWGVLQGGLWAVCIRWRRR